jgi:hypothetical protein
VEERAVADHFALLGESDATLADPLVERIQAFEVGVDRKRRLDPTFIAQG